MDDEAFRALQITLMRSPVDGDMIEGTGGLRIIYFWWEAGKQFWLFTLYNKDEMHDLSAKDKKVLKEMIRHELEARQ